MTRPLISLVLVSLLLLILSAGLVHPAAAQQTQPASPTVQQAPAPPPAKEEVTSYRLSPEKYRQAVAYSRARYRLYFIGFVYGVIVLLVVLAGRVAPRLRDLAERASGRRFVQALVYTPLLLLTVDVLGLPTSLYGHWLSRKYEQSIQGWGSWFWDWTKGELISFLVGIFLVWILYGVIRRSPRRWWFYFWLAALPILIFILFLAPLVIQPLFFKFEPLAAKQPALVEEIQKVVQRGGLEIPRERMFEMKASEKLKALNAYVAGFGASKRVVVWDTTIQRATTPQLLFVFGHEMGHYVLGHILRLIIVSAIVLLVFLFLGYRGMRWALAPPQPGQARGGSRWAIRGVDDWASLPVLTLFFALFGFLGAPLFNSYSRALEHDADVYGLEVIHGIVPNSGQVAAEAFQILGEINLADPEPSAFIKVWLYDHPPLGERLVFAREYDPWSKGEPPRFVRQP